VKKTRDLHIIFFYLFLFTVPFQTRKVFLNEYSFYSGAFTEYSTYYIYLSDILLVLALFFWLITSKRWFFLCNKSLKKRKNSKTWQYLAIFMVVLILNLLIKKNYLEIGIYQFFKFAELTFLLFFIASNLKETKVFINSLLVIAVAGFIQGIIAIQQFINQGSVFNDFPMLQKIFGESSLVLGNPGVANFIFEGQKVFRSYGTFPHPNVLASFLIFSLLMTVYLHLESKSGNLSSKLGLCSYKNTKHNICQGVLYSLVWISVIFVQCAALLLTFSRSALISVLVSSLIVVVLNILRAKIVSRETILARNSSINKEMLGVIDKKSFSKNFLSNTVKTILAAWRFFKVQLYKLFHFSSDSKDITDEIVSRETIYGESIGQRLRKYILTYKELFISLVLSISLLISYFPLINSRLSENFYSASNLPNNYAVSDRNFYNNVSRETISQNYILGSGLGTYIFQIDSYLNRSGINKRLRPWEYQPAHNIYFLIASEVGIMGLLVFLLLVFEIMLRSTKSFFVVEKKKNAFLFNQGIIKQSKTVLLTRILVIINILRNYFGKNVSRETFLNYKKSVNLSGLLGVRDISDEYDNENDSDYLLDEIATNNVSRETFKTNKNLSSTILLIIIVTFIIIGLFDHYFWTLQQGRLLFWLVLGLLVVSTRDV